MIDHYERHYSAIDKSYNAVITTHDKKTLEARGVQRKDDTFIVYLSSAAGCNLACRFCHLTQQRQTDSRQASLREYYEQAEIILHLANERGQLDTVKTIHFNFMARGDALSNRNFIIGFGDLHHYLNTLAGERVKGVSTQYKISTIFPEDSPLFTMENPGQIIDDILSRGQDIEFYYSLYSLNEKFRKRWIPKGVSPDIVGALFAERDHGLRLHHALIAGQNDSEEDVLAISQWLSTYNIHTRLNIVRYNSFDDGTGVESSQDVIDAYVAQASDVFHIDHVQIIPRVGRDVSASCGTFVNV